MATLTMNKSKPKDEWGIRDYIQRLSATRKRNFESELMTISLAYYLNTDWKMVRTKIANQYTIGTLKDVGEYIRAIDDKMIELITRDYIQSYKAN